MVVSDLKDAYRVRPSICSTSAVLPRNRWKYLQEEPLLLIYHRISCQGCDPSYSSTGGALTTDSGDRLIVQKPERLASETL